jgi:hypothetical protein
MWQSIRWTGQKKSFVAFPLTLYVPREQPYPSDVTSMSERMNSESQFSMAGHVRSAGRIDRVIEQDRHSGGALAPDSLRWLMMAVGGVTVACA